MFDPQRKPIAEPELELSSFRAAMLAYAQELDNPKELISDQKIFEFVDFAFRERGLEPNSEERHMAMATVTSLLSERNALAKAFDHLYIKKQPSLSAEMRQELLSAVQSEVSEFLNSLR
jgi:hypothetical protein